MAGRSAGLVGIGFGTVVVIGFIAAYSSGALSLLSDNSSTNNISEQETKIISDVQIKSFTTNPNDPTELTILDNEEFVLAPKVTKTFQFTLDNPQYPIIVNGEMSVTDHNEKVTFFLREIGSSLNLAQMTTSSNYIKATIDSAEITEYSVIQKNRQNPTFTAIFENLGDKEQMITANLVFAFD